MSDMGKLMREYRVLMFKAFEIADEIQSQGFSIPWVRKELFTLPDRPREDGCCSMDAEDKYFKSYLAPGPKLRLEIR